jgi:methionyl aminopeptidase
MIKIKTQQEIEIMAEGGKILAEILKKIADEAKPGIATCELDKLARELISSYKATPAFLNYGGFPSALCVSVNDIVVHGVPSDKKLRQGEIVSLDFGINYKGYNTDMALTVPVLGNMSYKDWMKNNPKLHKLLDVTRESLELAIEQAVIGNKLGQIGYTIQKYVEKNGFNVVRDLVGHGIGKELHEDPPVPNFGKSSQGPELVEGMVLAIEPMVVSGDWHLKLADDGFGYFTLDGSPAAHFEHTVVVTSSKPRVLTLL